MLSPEALRKIDSLNTANLTNDELQSICCSFYELGQLMFEEWKRQKFDSKNPVWSLTVEQEEHTI